MNVLDVQDITVDYRQRQSGLFGGTTSFRAVDHVSFQIPKGTTLALVGESGSGKTTVARAILGLTPLTTGRILIDGCDVSGRASSRGRVARRRVQMVFQQPSGSLDPRVRVGASVAEPLVYLSPLRGKSLQARVEELLDLVGLDRSLAQRYPRQLSGGQRQRVAIARAIAISPSLVICDEPTSSLDISIQAQVLNLLVRLQEVLGLSYLFISHDLAVVRQVADAIAVIKEGRVVEFGAPDELLERPKNAYTRQLVDAVPSIEMAFSRRATLGQMSSSSRTHRRPLSKQASRPQG